LWHWHGCTYGCRFCYGNTSAPCYGTEETVSDLENTTGLSHTNTISNAILRKPWLQIHQFLYNCHFCSTLVASTIFVHGRRRVLHPA
jgi:hypothetical protein